MLLFGVNFLILYFAFSAVVISFIFRFAFGCFLCYRPRVFVLCYWLFCCLGIVAFSFNRTGVSMLLFLFLFYFSCWFFVFYFCCVLLVMFVSMSALVVRVFLEFA